MCRQNQTLLPDRIDDCVDKAKTYCLTGMMIVSTKPKLTAWTGMMIVSTKPKLTAWTGMMTVSTKPKRTALQEWLWCRQSQNLLPYRNGYGVDKAKTYCLTGMVMVSTKPNLTAWTGMMTVSTKPKRTALQEWIWCRQSQTSLDRNDDSVDKAKPLYCLTGMMAMSTTPNFTE